MINSRKDAEDVKESMKFLASASARILQVLEETSISGGDLTANQKLLLHELRDKAVSSRHEFQRLTDSFYSFFSWHNAMTKRGRKSA